MADDPRDLPALQLVRLLRAGRPSVATHTASVLARIAERNPALTAFAEVTGATALVDAARLDTLAAAEREALPLFGVPVAVKNEIDVAGVVTRYGGTGNTTPATTDAEVVRRLRTAGAVVVGVTHQPEFGQGPYTEGAWGATRNPWRAGFDCAGSSGGSAVAVASGLVSLALGSDAGGSVRLPAAAVGVVGLKPTRGSVPLAPLPHLWHGLGCYGPLARTVADTAAALDVIVGESTGAPVPDRPLRVAWTPTSPVPVGPVDRAVATAVTRAAQALATGGHDTRRFTWRLTPRVWAFPVQAWLGIAAEVAAVEHPERLERRSRETARLARLLPPGALAASLRAGERSAAEVDALLGEDDVLLLPTRPDPPQHLLRTSRMGSIASQAASVRAVACTSLFNLTGHPAAAVPCGRTTDGLPVSVQVVGRRGREADVLAVAAALEAALPGPARPVWPPR